ncbi:MAG: hypothetical protein Q4A41_05860 [Bacillota bacterium]|nr:hypothetical protein [Bacillota bacterium]
MKIDTTKIEGYAQMSAEDKLKALEAFDLPDPDYAGYIKKEQFDKVASELAAKKKELNQKLTDDEQKSAAEAERVRHLEESLAALQREKLIAEHKANLIGLGYDDALAQETATAYADGKNDVVLANQKKHLEAYKKQIESELLKSTPKPQGNSAGGVNKEDFSKLSLTDKAKMKFENPALYEELSKL